MNRQRWLSRVALVLLALVAELAGRSLAHRIDVGRHVGPVSYRHADYYPFLLGAVKVGIALMLARVAWRVVRARRVASILGASPRVRVQLSARLWLTSFAATSVIYLVQMDAEHGSLLWPWLHTSALPVFAVLAVVVAAVHRTVGAWLHAYEQLAAHALECVRRLAIVRVVPIDLHVAAAPRRRFGLAFESRPPPLAV